MFNDGENQSPNRDVSFIGSEDLFLMLNKNKMVALIE